MESLTQLSGRGQRIAVFGDMLELGEFAAEEHRLLGAAAARHADRLVTVGSESANIAAGARAAGMDPAQISEIPADVEHGETIEAALDAVEALLESEVGSQQAVLIKGSHGMGLYRLADRWADAELEAG